MSEEKAVFVITSGLAGIELRKINKPYVVVDHVTRKVIASDDSSLIGKTWELEVKTGTHSSGAIPLPPLPFQIALWLAEAKFTHDTIYAALPAGLSVEVELKPSNEGMVWYNWAMTFGALVNPLVVLTHWHRTMMLRHNDPLYYSIASFVYPLNLKVTRAAPHCAIITNGDSTTQTAEATFWYIETDQRGAKLIDDMWRGLRNMLLTESAKLIGVE